MNVTYGSSSWNSDSTKVDSAYLMIKDKNTGKIVQIFLEETEPDSATFSGRFSLSLSESEKVAPEIFIPPSDLRNSDTNNAKVIEMVRNNELPRKPVIFKKNDRGQTVLDVYDTREQAETALKQYQDQQKIANDLKLKAPVRGVPNRQDLEAAKLAELKRLELQASKREADRIRLEQIEKQKSDERARLERQLSEVERAKRRAQADALATEANALYDQGKFPEAELKYKKCIELDPTNTKYHFRYGVTLYRVQKFDDALVVLKLAPADPSTDNEKNYYQGLVHYRLGELKQALNMFNQIAKTNDPVMGPSAEFYSGVIEFTQENFEKAKAKFEKVLDISSDPRLDDQAEEYLDRVAAAMVFKKMREKKFTLTGTVGVMYDSNVLLVSDSNSDQAEATDNGDFRFLTGADLEYRAVYTEKYEVSPKVAASLTNSLKDESAPADPWLVNVSIPSAYKGTLFKKGFKAALRPVYENLIMDPNETGSKSTILSSLYLVSDNTIIMRPNWFSMYSFEYRQDDSQLPVTSLDDRIDATKISLRTTQTYMADKKKIWVASAGYVRNNAVGKNQIFNRIELGVTHVRPALKHYSWFTSLNHYQVEFPENSNNRKDLNYAVTSGLSRPVRDWVTWTVLGTYTINDSTVPTTFEYKKWMIMTTATFTQVF